MDCKNSNLNFAHYTAQIGQSAIGIGFVHSTDKYNRLTSITVLGLGNKKALMHSAVIFENFFRIDQKSSL